LLWAALILPSAARTVPSEYGSRLGIILLLAAVGDALALALGMTSMTAFYVAAALTFSSTVIIAKLLSDEREIDALHGLCSAKILHAAC
jgi:predicted Kef-type K+ transport protein